VSGPDSVALFGAGVRAGLMMRLGGQAGARWRLGPWLTAYRDLQSERIVDGSTSLFQQTEDYLHIGGTTATLGIRLAHEF
jgi:hypothetical protein